MGGRADEWMQTGARLDGWMSGRDVGVRSMISLTRLARTFLFAFSHCPTLPKFSFYIEGSPLIVINHFPFSISVKLGERSLLQKK